MESITRNFYSFLGDVVASVAPTLTRPSSDRVLPVFSERPDKVGHIFRRIEGHLSKDTPENRAYILRAVEHHSNWVGRTSFGEDIYLKLMPDGTQAWAYVYKGYIVNGGRNLIPKSWVVDLGEAKGGRFVPMMLYQLRCPSELDFRVRVRFQKLVETHRSMSIARKGIAVEQVKGVSQEYGVILNLFEGVEALVQKEHQFLLPTPEGLFLEEGEIQQILRELAMGIFVHGQVPWFSLSSRADGGRLPVVHPIYQNTFVGHVLSLLDYYMKSFDGVFYTPEFIAEWAEHPNLDDGFLRENSINFREYCKRHGKQIRSFQEELAATKQEMNPACSLTDFYRTVSMRLIAKQKPTIKRGENLFQIDGDFAIEFSVKPVPETDNEHDSYVIYQEASRRHCAQVQEIMPQLPLFKKYFQALSVINFFSSYYVSLQNAHKVPILTEKPLSKARCPTVFPPIPITTFQQGWLCMEVASLWSSMKPGERERVVAAIQGASEIIEGDSAVKIVADHIEFSLDPLVLTRAAINFLKEYRKIYKDFNYSMEEGVVRYGAKERGAPTTPEVERVLIQKFEQYIQLTEEDIKEIQDEIAKRRRSNQPVDVLLAEVLKKETFNKEMRVSIEMYLSWFKDPVTAASHKRIFVFDIVNQRVIFRNERPKGQPILTGGCALRLVDKRAEEEQGLVQLWQESQTKMQNAVPERLVQVEGGVLFKLGFEDLSLVDEEERAGASGLFASKAGRSLTEREIKAFQAVERSDKDAFAQTVLENWDVKNARGVALVHYAAVKANTYFLQTMIRRGVQLHVVDDHKFTPLHYAAAEGNLTALELLITAKPELIHARGENGETALYLAAENGHGACVTFLLRRGSLPNIVTTQGFTPLLVAMYQGFEEAALELLNIDLTDIQVRLPDNSNVMHLAVEKKMERVCTHVVRYIDPRMRRNGGYTAFHMAAEQGWLFGIQAILKEHPEYDINMRTYNEKTALQLAVDKGHERVARFLRGQRPLEEIAQPSLGEEPTVIEFENVSLYDACRYGDLDEVHKLLKQGIDPYLENAEGFSAFDIAVSYGWVDVARKLTVEYAFPEGRKPYVQISAERGDMKMVAWLAMWGAPLDASNAKGETGIQCAAQKGNRDMVSLLLCLGANPESAKQGASAECKELIERYERILATTRDRKEIAARLNDRNALSVLTG